MRKVRNIVEIDEELCNGCGQCILDCAEGALELVDGKARLVGEVLCDGLGACLGGCPTGALTVSQREADDFDEGAVDVRLRDLGRGPVAHGATSAVAAVGPAAGTPQSLGELTPPAGGCPGRGAMTMKPKTLDQYAAGEVASQLGHWPIKLQLLSPQAPFLRNQDLLLLADCAAASLPSLHARLLPGRAVALACPKLDDAEAHIAKLAQLLEGAKPRSLAIVHMEVPCCRGLEYIAAQALERSGSKLPVGVVVVSRDGRIIEARNTPWLEEA